MIAISELISRSINATPRKWKEEEEIDITDPVPSGMGGARYADYEREVFNYLAEKKVELGIQGVARFKNRLVDGQIVLSTGQRLVVEIKLRMNWLKACQSEWQFRQFLKRHNKEKTEFDGAIVVFEEFSGDWNRKATKAANNVWGWDAWYIFHHDTVADKPMALLQFCNRQLQGYPG